MTITVPYKRSVVGTPLSAAQYDATQDLYHRKTSGVISVMEYGAIGNGVADDTAAIQAAIDASLTLSGTSPGGSYRVYLPPGVYKITDSLRMFTNNGTSFAFTSVCLGGDARGYVTNSKTKIVPTFVDKPAIIIQGARRSKIHDVSIMGSANTLVLPTYAQLLDDAVSPWYNTGGARDQAFSPYCGIAIDPFGVDANTANHYPGLAYYNKGSQGSTEVLISDVECQGFIVGIAVNTSAATQLGDSISINRCNLSYNRISCCVGQSQNRGVVLTDCHVKGAQVVIDTGWGQGNGPLPNVVGGVFVFLKYLLNGNSGWGQGSIKNLYAESMWSLGFWGQNSGGFPLTFDNCHMKHIYPQAGSLKNTDMHLNAGGPVIFQGGYWGFYSNTYRRMSVYNAARVVFDGVSLDGEPMFQARDKVVFRDALLRYSGHGIAYGISMNYNGGHDVAPAANGYILVPPGGRVSTTAHDEYMYVQAWDSVAVDGSITITANGDGSGSFVTVNPGRVAVGDYIATLGGWTAKGVSGAALSYTYSQIPIGRVSSIVSTTINLNEMPIDFVTGSYTPYTIRLPSYKARSIGTTTSASADITAVSPVASWAVGDKIKGTGIPVGAYVTVKAGTTLTINVPATATGTTGIWDADMRLVSSVKAAAPTSGVWFRGDVVWNSAPAAAGVPGWVCTTTGEPGTWKAMAVLAT